MRVLADVARFHPEIDIPLEPVLHALNGPTTTDRNKAAAIVAGLVARPDGAKRYREVIQQAGPTLLKLLALEQPNNHDLAYHILQQVSGKDLSPTRCLCDARRTQRALGDVVLDRRDSDRPGDTVLLGMFTREPHRRQRRTRSRPARRRSEDVQRRGAQISE